MWGVRERGGGVERVDRYSQGGMWGVRERGDGK